ncbi:MAG: hypothetical protein QGH76_05285, partial [Phycisphaerales bacterium]|nr:hypothetical protein [Phycisphaerales bacterium]
MFEIQRVVHIRPSRVFRLSLASVMFAGMFLCGGPARAQDASLIERWESSTPLQVAMDQSRTVDPAVTTLEFEPGVFESLKDQGHVVIRQFPINPSETVDLVLEQYFPYVPNLISQSLEVDARGQSVLVETPVEIQTIFFRGTVDGEVDSMAVLNLMPGMCSGIIEVADTRHHITTDPATGITTISDPLADQPGLQTLRKMMRDVEKQADAQPPYRGGGVPTGCAEIRLWIAYGPDYLALFADSGAAENYGAQVTALVSAIMVRDGIAFVGLTLGGFTGPGSTPLWNQGTLAADLCAATNTIFGSAVFGVPPLIATPPAADACIILRTGAAGASTFGNATKQSTAWLGGLTTGVTPNGACPPGTTSYFGACSGLVGDGGQYDTYIFAQALGTLCGAAPTGQTAAIDITAAAVPLAFDACDTGACSHTSPGTIMSMCEPSVGVCVDPDAFNLRFNSLNASTMNAFLTGVAGALIAPGGLPPAPIQGVAATVGGAGNCNQVVVTWTPDVNSTTTFIWRNSVNEFNTDPPLSPIQTLFHAAGADPGTYTDTVATGGVIYYYWVTASNICGTNTIADQYNPQIISQGTNPPTFGQGAQGMIGSGQAEIPGVVAGV